MEENNLFLGGIKLKDFLYWIVEGIALFHGKILQLNDSFETTLSDKELHFLVIGIIGMIAIFIIYPLFLKLSRKHVLVIAWMYVFTLIIVLTFAIEIGQKITDTGEMEFSDIMFGVVGFLSMFAVFCIIRAIFKEIKNFIIKIKNKNKITEKDELEEIKVELEEKHKLEEK